MALENNEDMAKRLAELSKLASVWREETEQKKAADKLRAHVESAAQLLEQQKNLQAQAALMAAQSKMAGAYGKPLSGTLIPGTLNPFPGGGAAGPFPSASGPTGSAGTATSAASTIKPKTKAEQTFDIHTAISRNEKERRLLMYVNAKLLSHMERTKEYQTILGDPNGTWKQYLAQIEVFYPRSTVHKMIRVYRKLTESLKLSENAYDDIPLSRLFQILPVIEATNADEWLEKARTLITSDWTIEVRAAKGLTTIEDEHEHDFKTIKVCEVCGAKEHEHEEEAISGAAEEAVGQAV